MQNPNIALFERFVPKEAATMLAEWVDQYQAEIKITKKRTSKFGDYRHPFRKKGHRISINHDLNPYAFLITLVHEFAHLTTWNLHKNKVKPHGNEWKQEFKRLMQPFFGMKIFPEEIDKAVRKYFIDPAASSCTDLNLLGALQKFDPPKPTVTVKSLPLNTVFFLENGRSFRKEGLAKKRFRCKEVGSGKIYLFNPLAEVYTSSGKVT